MTPSLNFVKFKWRDRASKNLENKSRLYDNLAGPADRKWQKGYDKFVDKRDLEAAKVLGLYGTGAGVPIYGAKKYLDKRRESGSP